MNTIASFSMPVELKQRLDEITTKDKGASYHMREALKQYLKTYTQEPIKKSKNG